MADELKACAFCCGTAKLSERYEAIVYAPSQYQVGWQISCQKCGVKMIEYTNSEGSMLDDESDSLKKAVIKRWNTRTLPEASMKKETVFDKFVKFVPDASLPDGTAILVSPCRREISETTDDYILRLAKEGRIVLFTDCGTKLKGDESDG